MVLQALVEFPVKLVTFMDFTLNFEAVLLWLVGFFDTQANTTTTIVFFAT